jgi:hypothetical protein
VGMKDPARHATKSCGDMTTQQTAREETRPAGVSLLRRGAVGVRGEHGSGLAGGGLGLGWRRMESGLQPLQGGVTRVWDLPAHKLRDPGVADVGGLGNPGPVAAAAVKFGAEPGVEFGVHRASIAIFCECGKQHFANQL